MKEEERIKKIVSENIKKLRMKVGLSQKETAERAGIHIKSYERIERVPQNLTLENLTNLAKALEVEIVDLFEGLPQDSLKPPKSRFKKPSEALRYAIEILNDFKAKVD